MKKRLLIISILTILLLGMVGTASATIKWENNASSTMAAGIGAGYSQVTVATGEGDKFPAVSAPHYFMVTLADTSGNRELVKCTSRTSGNDTLSITRAQEGTSALAWDTGDIVSLRVSKSSLDYFSKSVDVNAHIYVADPAETDQGAAGSGGTILDILSDEIGSSKRATIVLPHLAENGYTTTTYTLGTTLDASAYTAVTLLIQPGAKLDCVASALTWGGHTIAMGENAFGNDTGYTITLQTVEAGNYRIFDNLAGNAEISAKQPINLRWFGMDPDATSANNYSFFQKGINALSDDGGKIFLNSAGTYAVDGDPEVTTSNTIVEFERNVLLQPANTHTALSISGAGALTRVSNIIIRGLNVDGIYAHLGILVEYADDTLIENCIITKTNTSTGIAVTGTSINSGYRNKIKNCKLSSIGGGAASISGILAQFQNDLTIEGCHIDTASGRGIYVLDSTGISIINNTVKNTTLDGIFVTNRFYGQNTGGKISGNTIVNSANYGLAVGQAQTGGLSGTIKGLAVSDNVSYSNSSYSYSIYGATANPISNLSFSGNKSYTPSFGSVIQQVIYSSFTGNIIYSTTLYGMILTGVQNSSFSGNIVASTDIANFLLQNSSDLASLNNMFSGNTLIHLGTAHSGFEEYTPTGSSNYNKFAGNKFVGFDRTDHYRLVGANSVVTESNWIDSYSSTTTGTSTAEIQLYTATVGSYELGSGGILRITATGTKTGANGNKTLKAYFGSQSVTFHAAANNTSDWRMDLMVYNTSLTTQRMVVLGAGTGAAGTTSEVDYATGAINTKADVNITITGQCANGADSIGLTMAHGERLK